MAKGKTLKVFRTPIGFHDAYIAVTSQEAALQAWGTKSNLFARGEAEIVTDPELVDEPLKHPGTIIKRLRGNARQHLAALPEGGPKRASGKSGKKAVAAPRAKPKPNRAALTKLEQRLSSLEASQTVRMAALKKKLTSLRKQIDDLERAQRAEKANAERAVERARDEYEDALRQWAD